ncbi:TRAP transporter large permease [Falsihalocynthiibacter arcticus]|uniref:TRAP transporter large permease protein n=1 Tax=Falsihalocynthiibacter arcticus TaxID=1579316 RepID=A0A126UWK2_9RHOB|nr:TRAP transporter large permease subunit [Falsihalocynthiibacter arcticus]AML50438.1 L-dehydroascorbate transporter large permease subunit [Falsihalocynthiibacter arcticus]
MTLIVFLGTLLGSMAIGIPVGYALIMTGIALMYHLDFFQAQIVAQNMLNGADSFPLMAIPFFMLAGEVMNAGGLSKRIVNLSVAAVGHIRGGLGYVAILAAIILASLSGSAAADTAALAAILVPMMIKAGHEPGRSAGLIASAGISALIIPPSIGFILIGVVGNISITKIFIAGIVPGMIMGMSLVITWYFVSRSETGTTSVERVPLNTVLREAWAGIWALMLPVIILVGLRFGVFTPTEAGVIAAVYALFVAMFIYRELKVADLFDVFLGAAKTTAMVMFLVAGALVSSWMITIAGLTGQINDIIAPFADRPIMLMAVIVVLVLIIGCAMDMVPIILILVPVFLPSVKAAGIDPVYFAVVFMIAGAVGLLTPPVGSVLNVVAGVSKVPLPQVIKGIWPFIIAQLIVLILLIIFPQIITAPAEFLQGE